MITEQERKRRRLKYRLVQLVLVMLTLGIGIAFWTSRRGVNFDADVNAGRREITIATDVPAASQLAPGDMQLFNEDSTVDLILQGRHILAGLSPKTVERIRSEIRNSGPDDSSGIAGFIASTVKEQVADKIGTHVRYDITDIDDIRLEGDRLVMDWKSGKQQELFESVKIDRERGRANRFRRDEALRFIELVKERQRQIEDGSFVTIPPTRP
jgi:hypothetical protein